MISHSSTQTEYIGQRLGDLLQQGDVLLLLGEIGVGKTHLAKGIVQGMGSSDLVTSPSFVLVNEYRAGPRWPGLRIYHLDLYRIGDAAEVTTIGLDDMLDGAGVCLIEWAERAADWLPVEHLAISLRPLDETRRVLRFEPHGERYQHLVEAFRRAADKASRC
ncbi:MAG: tRNA (adenosine(37)-N6)-threonylcarbamoyltransferase complex ATPase subunit type 1 TsaE [Chloroflexaceae bacterium]|nr:tRNA (adenosine(37)-N6)-threonylcarbamoyltransferase complex ATPase subunit type 1 TsaE [Chloroflexaceae bacterium]